MSLGFLLDLQNCDMFFVFVKTLRAQLLVVECFFVACFTFFNVFLYFGNTF